MATLASVMVSLGLRNDVGRGARQAESDLADLESQAGETDQAFQGLGEGMKAAGTAAGAAAGAGLAKGVFDNLNLEQANAKLAAQLNLGAQQAEQAGNTASELFRSGFGEDIGQVNEAMRSVVQSMNTEVGSVNFEPLTKSALGLAKTFDVEVSEGARAAGQLIKTGLAENGQEAFDILTAGFSNGVNEADDLLDTMEEYPIQFKDLGLSGAEAMGLLSQGLDAGAQNSDKVADALKELNIRTKALDNKKALQQLGLDAQQMASAFAEGGPQARKALQQITGELSSVQDPAERARLAVELFGTQGEDMGKALGALDLSSAAQQIGQVEGATQQAGETMRDTSQNQVTQMQRQFEGLLQDAAALPGPLGGASAAVAAFGPSALSVLGPLASMRAAQSAAGAAAMVSGTQQAAAANMVRLGWIRAGVAATANGIRMAAAWLIAMGPIAIVIGLVIGLVILIIANWDKIWKFTKKIWSMISGWIVARAKEVWDWIKGHWHLLLTILTGPFGAAIGFIIKHWKSIKNGIVSGAQSVISFVRSIPGKITSALGNLGSLLLDAGRNLISGLIDGIKSKFGAVGEAASNIASRVRDFLPFSPAKEGPLSGMGSPNRAGSAIADMLSSGMLARLDTVEGAAGALAGAASVDAAGTAHMSGGIRGTTRRGGDQVTVRLVVDGADSDLKRMIRKMVRVDGGNVQTVLGSSNV